MKVEIFTNTSPEKIQDDINKFIKSVNVKDIKLCADDDGFITVLVLYKEQYD